MEVYIACQLSVLCASSLYEKSVTFCYAAQSCINYYMLHVTITQRLATGWTVRGSNPGGSEIFRTCPDWPCGPPSLLYNGYRVFLGDKQRPGRDPEPSPFFSAVGHERVGLYLYSPSRPHGLYRASVPVRGRTLHLPYKYRHIDGWILLLDVSFIFCPQLCCRPV